MMDMNGRKQQLIIITIILAIAALTAAALSLGIDLLYTVPAGAVRPDPEWTVADPAGNSSLASVPAYLIRNSKNALPAGIARFSTVFTADSRIEHPVLVLPVVAGNALELYFNGIYIGTRGDMSGGRSSIWNASHSFVLPFPLTPGVHTLEVRVRLLYEAGVVESPYITDSRALPFRTRMLLFYNNEMMYIIHGILVILALLFMITGALTLPDGRGKIGFGAAQLLIAFFLLDYTCISSIPISYLAWKKLVSGAIHIALAVLYLSFKPLYGKKPGRPAKALVLLELAIVLALFLLPQDLAELRRLYTFLHMTMFLFICYVLISGIPLLMKNRRMVILFCGMIFTLAMSVHDILGLVLSRGTVFYSHIGVLGFILSASLLIILDILEQYRSITIEKRRADSFYERSIKDPLTGAYNRTVLDRMDSDFDGDYILVLFDLDNFKRINDSYGHTAGDAVLKNLVAIIREHTRSGDLVVRQGGDEFALVLPSCSPGRAAEITAGIEEAVSRETIESDAGNFSYGCSMGTAARRGEPFAEIYRMADKELYLRKELRKKRLG